MSIPIDIRTRLRALEVESKECNSQRLDLALSLGKIEAQLSTIATMMKFGLALLGVLAALAPGAVWIVERLR